MSTFTHDAIRAIRADLDLLRVRHQLEHDDPIIRRIDMTLTRIDAHTTLTKEHDHGN